MRQNNGDDDSSSLYQLLDSGHGRKLERFGSYVLNRPCAQAVWEPEQKRSAWRKADAVFTREGGNRWEFCRPLPSSWKVKINELTFEVSPTDFGHIGMFPEHLTGWQWMKSALTAGSNNAASMNVLNLFAYSGGATLVAARLGFSVCHLDASRKMVDWARRNAGLNDLDKAPIRWIVDDVQKFLVREKRRNRCYHGLVLDPPSFGHGTRQELFKIDTHLLDILKMARDVLVPEPLFVFFSCHTPGYTPLVLKHLLEQTLGLKASECGEMTLPAGQGVRPVPSGTYAAWRHR